MPDMELHYIDADADSIWEEITAAWYAAGGDILYPGDEKEMLLRAVQLYAITILCKVDTALKMDTLTYAVRDYLKEYGLKRNCVYIEAIPAEAPVTMVMAQTDYARTLPAGTTLTADGTIIWETTEDIALTGAAQTIQTTIRCQTAGAAGNGLTANTEMQFMEGLEGLTSCTVTADASGGVDAEDEEAYRERIRTYGLAAVTTGPKDQYEQAAKAVSTQVVDAAAVNGGAGEVEIYLLPGSSEGTAALIAAVEAALSADDVRPLNDHVTVALATGLSYTLNVEYQAESGMNIAAAIDEAVAEYQRWQDTKIGRAFNPDRLKALLYQAGCSLVTFGSGSEFDGGTVEYTEIDENEYCSGTITVAVMET